MIPQKGMIGFFFLFFFNHLMKTQVSIKGEETMRKAYVGIKAKIRETQKAEEISKLGSVSVLVINEVLVTASMGDYGVVLCINGVAQHINGKRQQLGKMALVTQTLFHVNISYDFIQP